MKKVLISDGMTIERAVITNLLSAHKRIADSGNAAEVVRITKYLLKLAEKRKDILVNIISAGPLSGPPKKFM